MYTSGALAISMHFICGKNKIKIMTIFLLFSISGSFSTCPFIVSASRYPGRIAKPNDIRAFSISAFCG